MKTSIITMSNITDCQNCPSVPDTEENAHMTQNFIDLVLEEVDKEELEDTVFTHNFMVGSQSALQIKDNENVQISGRFLHIFDNSIVECSDQVVLSSLAKTTVLMVTSNLTLSLNIQTSSNE